MAVMTSQERNNVCISVMRQEKINLKLDDPRLNITKAELRAAVDALDTYLNDNAATINNALPVAARTNLTSAQKAALMMYVISRRYLVGA